MKIKIFLLLFFTFSLFVSGFSQIAVHSNGKSLITKDRKPFYWMGDTDWELFHRLTRQVKLTTVDAEPEHLRLVKEDVFDYSSVKNAGFSPGSVRNSYLMRATKHYLFLPTMPVRVWFPFIVRSSPVQLKLIRTM